MGDYQAHFDQGQEHFFAQEWEEAARCYQLALASQPEEADGLMNLGSCQFMLKQYQACITTLLAYRKVDKRPDVLFTLGMAYHHTEQYEAAVGIFDEIVRDDPMHTRAIFQAGMAQMESGELAEAADRFRSTLMVSDMGAKLDPDTYDRHTDALALYNLIKVSVRLEEWEEVAHKVGLASNDFEEPELPLEVAKHLPTLLQRRKLLQILLEQCPDFHPAREALDALDES